MHDDIVAATIRPDETEITIEAQECARLSLRSCITTSATTAATTTAAPARVFGLDLGRPPFPLSFIKFGGERDPRRLSGPSQGSPDRAKKSLREVALMHKITSPSSSTMRPNSFSLSKYRLPPSRPAASPPPPPPPTT